jgi:hypothetical protein
VPRILDPARDQTGAPVGARATPSRNPVLALQRSIGNQAVARLLQRDPDSRDDLATLSKAAKDLGAAGLVNDVAAAGTERANFGFARQIRLGEKDGVKPGLNIVQNLGARGRTGFVDADGRYLGDTLPAGIAVLPHVAISIGRQAFDEGEVAVRGTLRHELEHAMHAQLLLGVEGRWRDSLTAAHKPIATDPDRARRDFLAFAGSDNASPSGGKLSPVQLDLVRGDVDPGAGKSAQLGSTELLAHLAGFVQTFQAVPAADASAIPAGLMPPAIEQLRGAAEHGFPAASDTVKAEARNRLVAFYKSLSVDKQVLLRDWLSFLRFRAVTRFPAGATTPEAKAAAIVFASFGRHLDFLDWMLDPIRGLVFAATALPAPSTRETVTVGARPKAAATDNVGSGTVSAFIDVPFTWNGDGGRREHGISLRYEGSDAGQARWLQFIWRELVPDGSKGIAGTGVHQGVSYPLTTEPGEPSQIGWNTDTATYRQHGAGAFYEVDNAINRGSNSTEMFDEPSAPFAGDVRNAFKAARAGGGVTGRSHLVQFLIKGPDVVYRSEILYEYRYKAESDNPAGVPKLLSHGKASAIDPGARARLHEQFPDLDFLK